MFSLLSTGRILMVVVPLIAAGGGWIYVKNLQKNIELLEANQTVLNQAVESKDAEIERLNQNVQEVMERTNTLNAERDALATEVTGLRDKLRQHDLGFLAENKPGLVENIINKDIENTLKKEIVELMELQND
jgi:uncharacterized coiled-coil DUF342 family protein